MATAAQVLALPVDDDDSGASTVGGYLAALLALLIEDGEGFSGKRPFGNSGWEWDLYKPLVAAGFVTGRIDADGYLDDVDGRAAAALLIDSLSALGGTR